MFKNTTRLLKLILVLLFVITACNGDDNCDYKKTIVPPIRPCINGIDAAFLIDYSSSMREQINNVKNKVADIVDVIEVESNNNYRLALGTFDSVSIPGGPPFYLLNSNYLNLPPNQKIINPALVNPLINDIPETLTIWETFSLNNEATFTTQLNLLNGVVPLGNGFAPGDLMIHEVLNNNFAGNWRSGDNIKIIVLITDTFPESNHQFTTIIDPNNPDNTTFLETLATNANNLGVRVVLITSQPSTVSYAVSLVNNNNGGIALTGVDLNNIGDEIIEGLEAICE